MNNGTIVKNTSGQVGVVVHDSFCCCIDGEIPVVYDGTDTFLGTMETDLKEIGVYDPSQADIDKCGGGNGECSCKWLAITDTGATCLRFSDERNDILFRQGMRSKGSPVGLFPKCQDEIRIGIMVGIPAGVK